MSEKAEVHERVARPLTRRGLTVGIVLKDTRVMDMNKKKVVVFGATGNLGAYIAVHLHEQGYDVVAVGHRKSDNGFFKDRGMSYYSVNIEDMAAFDILPKEDIYAVAHFASSLPSRYAYDPVDLFESITIGTLNVLRWMQSVGCKKIVFPQTPSDMVKYHNNGSVIPCDAPRQFPLTGDHSIYTIAKNAAVDLLEHFQAECGFQFSRCASLPSTSIILTHTTTPTTNAA